MPDRVPIFVCPNCGRRSRNDRQCYGCGNDLVKNADVYVGGDPDMVRPALPGELAYLARAGHNVPDANARLPPSQRAKGGKK